MRRGSISSNIFFISYTESSLTIQFETAGKLFPLYGQEPSTPICCFVAHENVHSAYQTYVQIGVILTKTQESY